MSTSRIKNRYPMIVLGVITVIWGINAPIMKLGLNFLSPELYNACRMAIAAILSIVVMVITKSYKPMPTGDFRKIAMLSVLGFFLSQLLIMFGMAKTTAGNSSLIFATLPVEVALINRIFKIEAVSRRTMAGVIVGLFGVTLVILGSGKEISLFGPHLTGALLILAGMLCYGGYTVFIKELNDKYSPYQIIAYVMAYNAVLYTIIAQSDFRLTDWSSVPSSAVYSILFSATFALGIGNGAWIWVLGRLGSTKASLSQYLCPVIAIFFSWVFLEETFGLLQFTGAIVVLTGLYLTLNQPAKAIQSEGQIKLQRRS